MNAATERMTEVLRARGWKFKVEEESDLISTGCNGDSVSLSHDASAKLTDKLVERLQG